MLVFLQKMFHSLASTLFANCHLTYCHRYANGDQNIKEHESGYKNPLFYTNALTSFTNSLLF